MSYQIKSLEENNKNMLIDTSILFVSLFMCLILSSV